MKSVSEDSRLETELSLLEAMYPSQCQFVERRREISFDHSPGTKIVLRLPVNYPGTELPELISAQLCSNDIRCTVRQKIANLHLEYDIEVLDVIIGAFIEEAEDNSFAEDDPETKADENAESEVRSTFLTVIIWLHHLLATSKRKAALDSSSNLTGVTKPGYPGVILLSGTTGAVREHVALLKAMKWQAFQIRYEEPLEWKLNSNGRIIEVEKLGQVVDAIIEPSHKETFLDAMKVK